MKDNYICKEPNMDCCVPQKLPEKVSNNMQEAYHALMELNGRFVNILRMISPDADASAGPTAEPENMLENAVLLKTAAEVALNNISSLQNLL